MPSHPQLSLWPRMRRSTHSVLVSGYDLKFATGLAAGLARRGDLRVSVDPWRELGRPSRLTRWRLAHSDAVLAEWARTSAIWLTQRKRAGQFLVVRLHRFELDSHYPRQLPVERVDAVVYIAPLFGRRIRDELGWPTDKLVHIPNYLDVAGLDRPKLPEARFTLGMVGIEWSRKRFDLALDLLAAIRRRDRRYRLAVRSVMPWDNPYVWARPQERDYVADWRQRLERDPLLRDAVRFDRPGRDMPRWYRKVSHLLSTSDEEGSHLSVAEAMAAGTVPVVRHWPGATEVYDGQWVYQDPDKAVEAVLADTDPEVWRQRAARAWAEIRCSHNPARVLAAWADLLRGDLAAARTYFPHQQCHPVGPAGLPGTPRHPAEPADGEQEVAP